MAHHFLLNLFVHQLSILASLCEINFLVLFSLAFITVIQLRFELSIGFYCNIIISIYRMKHSRLDLDLGVVYQASLSKINNAFMIESANSSRLLI
jgi:hypothetical protein